MKHLYLYYIMPFRKAHVFFFSFSPSAHLYIHEQSRFQELIANTSHEELRTIATYYFNGQGKALRPMVAILVARAINYDKEQKCVYIII